MERKKLVRIEMFLSILIVIGIFFLVFNLFFILKSLDKEILYVNDKNRQSVEKIIEKSEKYDRWNNVNDIKKIQYFHAFNNLEFTIYYKDGTVKEMYDDSLIDLVEYMRNNGYNKGGIFVILGIGMIIICIGLNEIRAKVSSQIDLIDKQED